MITTIQNIIRLKPDQVTTTQPVQNGVTLMKRLITIMVLDIGEMIKTTLGAELNLRMASAPRAVPMILIAEVDMTVASSSIIYIRTEQVRFSIAIITVGQFCTWTLNKRIETRAPTQITARTRSETTMTMKRILTVAAITILLPIEIDISTEEWQQLTIRMSNTQQRITHIIANTDHLVRNENKMYTRRIIAIFNPKKEGIVKPTNIILASS